MSKEVSNYQTYITSPSVSTTTVNSSFENWLPKINNWAIGFDRHWDMLNNFHNSVTTTSYPPYNIIKVDEDDYTIEMAVAGFSKDDIAIETKENTLMVQSKDSGEDKTEVDTTEYLHKGISQRSFKKLFTLAEDVFVNGADMKDGLLYINLERIIPEEKKPKVIKIK